MSDNGNIEEVANAATRGVVGAMAMTGMRVPAYGLATWLVFELAVAPALKLPRAKQSRPVDRLFLALDHLLYGLVLSERRGGR